MNKITKLIFVMSLISIFVSCNFAPGSFPYAERYEIKADVSVLITEINNFINKNPTYKVRNNYYSNGWIGEQKLWYAFYFYFEKEDKILYTWVSSTFEKDKSTFAFVSVLKAEYNGTWKDINSDFGWKENKIEKKCLRIGF